MSDDLDVGRRYREVSAEEPPRALDDAILAAAREAQRPWTRRYAVPLGLAAVVVLSVTVTLRIQHERPGIEAPAPAAKAPEPAAVAQADTALKLKAEADIKPPAPERRARASVRDEAPQDKPRADEPRPFARPMGEAAKESVAIAAAPPVPAPAAPAMASRAELQRGAESSVAGATARQAEERTSRDAAAAARAPQAGPVEALAKRAALGSVATPEQELERIALLRREGKHDEADKALAEFRKRLPDYRIAEEMLQRVERR
jgi:hypothetical protein